MKDRLILLLEASTTEQGKTNVKLPIRELQIFKKFNTSKLILVFHGSLTAKSGSQE